jgi:hypothetical protein
MRSTLNEYSKKLLLAGIARTHYSSLTRARARDWRQLVEPTGNAAIAKKGNDEITMK